jgi:hypothetical protein
VPAARRGVRGAEGEEAAVRRRRVQSSVIRSAGYDAAASILELEFADSRAVYDYYDVPLSVYEELLSADSMGVYFNEFIKDLYASQQVK